MAALDYTAELQDRVFRSLGLDLATADTDAKEFIDNTWTISPLTGGVAYDALTYIQQVGQYFSLTTPANVPDTWASWLVARTAMLASRKFHPDRVRDFEEANSEAMMGALDAYNRVTISATPGATPEATTASIQNMRYYVVQGCVRRQRWETIEGSRRLKPRLFPDFNVVDHNIERVIRSVWNRAKWPFKQRKTAMKLTRYAVTNATWTEATKTITSTAGFATTIAAGSLVVVLDGTGVEVGHYIASSGTADTVVVTRSIATTAGNLSTGDIEVVVIAVSFPNLVSETFDRFGTRELHFNDSSATAMRWADADDMARMVAQDIEGESSGRPEFFRFENKSGTLAWTFAPLPDASYTLQTEVEVKGPTIPATVGDSTDTTAMARFPVEIYHVMKDAALAHTLDYYGERDGPRLVEKAEMEINRLLPLYTDVGRQDDDQSVRDVYDDVSDYSGSSVNFGGPLA